MCRYMQGNHCLLNEKCHCHPIRDHFQPGYNDGYEHNPEWDDHVAIRYVEGQLSQQG